MKKKQDCSSHVEQRDKIKAPLNIRPFPWNPKQKEFIDIALNKESKILIVDGPPGSSKTLLSVYCCLELLNDKRISDMVYIRSLVQSKDGQTGSLPGTLEERTEMYNVPLFDKLDELLSKSDIKYLINENRVQTLPTSMLRGFQFSVKGCIFDENQNATLDSSITAMTRLGKYSKLFICGDSKFQNDLGSKSGFGKLYQLFDDEDSKQNGIHCFKFTSDDITRSELVKFIVKKLEGINHCL